MPVKGVSDSTDRRYPRVGKIHLGKQKKGQNGSYPTQTSYFVVNTEENTPEDAAAAFREVYQDEPAELDIVFPHDDPAVFADPNYRAYSVTQGLLCKGDGETARAKWDPAGQGARPPEMKSGSWANRESKSWAYQRIPCHGPECPMQMGPKPQCKMMMSLQILLPHVRGIGIWQIDTSSIISIRNILSNIDMIKAATGGHIRGIPLKLRLVPQQVSPAGQKQKTVYVLDIYMPISFAELIEQAQKVPAGGLLPPPINEDELPEDLVAADVDGDEAEPAPVETTAKAVEDPPKGFRPLEPELDDNGARNQPATPAKRTAPAKQQPEEPQGSEEPEEPGTGDVHAAIRAYRAEMKALGIPLEAMYAHYHLDNEQEWGAMIAKRAQEGNKSQVHVVKEMKLELLLIAPPVPEKAQAGLPL